MWTFQCVDTSVRGHFSAGTLQYLDILVQGHFSAWTFQCVTISVRGLLSVPPVFLPVSEGFQNARGCVTVLRYVADQKQNNNKSRDSQSVLLSGSKELDVNEMETNANVEHNARFLETIRGKPLLVCQENYTYRRERDDAKKTKSYWVCTQNMVFQTL